MGIRKLFEPSNGIWWLVSHYWEVKEETNMSAVECRDETPSEKLDIVHGLEVYG